MVLQQVTKTYLTQKRLESFIGETLLKWNESDTKLGCSKKECQVLHESKFAETESYHNPRSAHRSQRKNDFRELCPTDDWSKDKFIGMSIDNSEKLPAVLTKKTEYQKSPEKRLNALTGKTGQPQNQIQPQGRYGNSFRGNFHRKNINRRDNYKGTIVEIIQTMTTDIKPFNL